jgi:hypothetical protein
MLVHFDLIVSKNTLSKEELLYIEDVLGFEEIYKNNTGTRWFTKLCTSFSLPIDSKFEELSSKSKFIAYVIFPKQES